jgi:hypothetical protein
MNDRLPFNPLQAQEVARAFNDAGVEYLFIGKSGAILLGYPGTTQDVDVFPAKSAENGERIVKALLELGFVLDDNTRAEIIRGKDFGSSRVLVGGSGHEIESAAMEKDAHAVVGK